MAGRTGRKSQARGRREQDGGRTARGGKARVWSGRAGEHLRTLIAAALLVTVGTAAYWNSFDGQFVFDDQVAIVENVLIRQLLPIERFFESSQPLTDFSLAINYAVGGLNPWGYHLFNLCVHLIAGLILFGIVRRTILHHSHPAPSRTGVPPVRNQPEAHVRDSRSISGLRISDHGLTRESDRLPRQGQAIFAAFAVALLWLVHPLQTESVTYLIQRCESMMGLFYLATLYAAIRAAEAARPGRWTTVAVLCCAAGMATKAVMVTAPVMVLLYDRTFLAGSFVEAIRRRWRLYGWLAATWLVLAGLGVFSGLLHESPETATVGFGYKGVTPIEYLQSQPGVILHYLRLAVWPVGQCLDYQWPVARGVVQVWLPAACVIVLMAASIWGTWRRHPLGFAGAWFFLILLPTSSFVPIKDLAFEHRMYLPLAGVVAAVVFAIAAVVRNVGSMTRPTLLPGWSKRLAWGGLLLASVGLIVLTVRRNALYADPAALWTQTIEQSPENARARNALGYEWIMRRDASRAIEHLEEAIGLDPQFAPAHANLGKAHLMLGHFEEAVRQFERAIEVGPEKLGADTYFAYGAALIELGRPAEAIDPLRRAISMRPDAELSYYNLANALWLSGERETAVSVYRQALSVNPAYTEARVNLGLVLVELGRVDEAITTYREAIQRFKPDGNLDALKKAHSNLGLALRSQGKNQEAMEHFHEALRIDPGHRPAITALEEMSNRSGLPPRNDSE